MPRPTCGNKAVDEAFGETMRRRREQRTGGVVHRCKASCRSLPAAAGRSTAAKPATTRSAQRHPQRLSATPCRIKCGNGFKDPGEDCDNGVNDGSYGTCNPNCTLAGYCGDNIKNGGEQCDNGAANASFAVAYGPGVCTIACTFAPYCGDGRVQASFGEQCDGTTSCDSSCKTFVPK
ncbi:MAG: hypothetical protein U0235_12450 [Polyangiaceae bacterium]